MSKLRLKQLTRPTTCTQATDMGLQELLDYLLQFPECTGTVSIMRDEIYGVRVKAEQDHGYIARVSIKNAMYLGRGLTPEKAVEALGKKLRAKFHSNGQ